jgi:SAM-dependent methyltransferase/ribosomal protein S18 acetylase RimI-like enzyme
VSGDVSVAIEQLDLSEPGVAEQLYELQRDAYRVEAELIEYDGIPPLHESLAELRIRQLDWRGIRIDGRIVAAIAVTGEARRCDIDRLVVDPRWHRRGLGRRLVESVLMHDIVTVSTGTANAPALALYESLGFRRINVREIAPGVTVTSLDRWSSHMATSFDADVGNYERARPAYPQELFDRVKSTCEIGPGTTILEIGPGTGQATLPLLDMGTRVVAVEPGPRMAARLRARVEGRPCEVVEATFEAADVTGPFDVAVAGTSFHWVDARVGIPKLAGLLRERGWLALWWNMHGPRDEAGDAFSAALEGIAGRFQTRGRRFATPYPRDVEARFADLTAEGHFEVVDHVELTWVWTHDPASIRALFASFSDWSTLPEPDRSHALDAVAAIVEHQFGGTVTREYTTPLFVARRL